ncbi:MAG: DUF4097 family beta strand repeat-containing protein [Candidatus Cryptobacteroides sp.]
MRKTFITLLVSVLALNSCIYTDPDILYIDGGADITEYVEDIDIDWNYGSVIIRYWENNYLSFYEEDIYSRPIDQPMCYYLKDGKLRIKYYRHSNSNRQYKKLCLNVPQGIVFKSLDIDANDAAIDVDLDAEYLDFDSVNGSIIYSTIYRYTKDIDIDTVNGEVNIILPVDASFSLDFDSVSGSLYSDFNLYRESDYSFSYGSRYTDIDVDTVNSDLYLSIYQMQ